jgi:DNA (cytosine-5)-methyltransferase 1
MPRRQMSGRALRVLAGDGGTTRPRAPLTPSTSGLRFVDLFAGLGGFHLALRHFGCVGVFASELDPVLGALYERNFGLRPAGDIRGVAVKDVPAHDILCAGFPCQPFSKAGDQQGFECPRSGDLFDHVLRIVRHHRPRYLIIENVPNLEHHDEGETFATILAELKRLRYDVRHHRLSPHRFGIPQVRDRLYIVASLGNLDSFEWPSEIRVVDGSIADVLERNPSDARPIPGHVVRCLNAWQEFLTLFPKEEQLPSYPIWSMEFGATYRYQRTTPYRTGDYQLRPFSGSHGTPLKTLKPAQRMAALPSHARTEEDRFPEWKVDFIRKNRDLYARHRRWIKPWLPKILEFPSSLQKLEWNCKGEERDIWKFIIQLRASGVRVKRPTTAPSLIAMTTTQVPIVAWERRYMTPRECARLQSMGALDHLPDGATRAFKALGNAVNVNIVELVAQSLFSADPYPLKSVGGTMRSSSIAEAH